MLFVGPHLPDPPRLSTSGTTCFNRCLHVSGFGSLRRYFEGLLRVSTARPSTTSQTLQTSREPVEDGIVGGTTGESGVDVDGWMPVPDDMPVQAHPRLRLGKYNYTVHLDEGCFIVQGLLKEVGVLLKDPGVFLKDPGVLLRDPGVLLKGPGVF